MAAYGISQQGADSLNKLAIDLKQSTMEIEQACARLYCQIESLEDGLGHYYKYIVSMCKDVIDLIRYVQAGEDGVDTLIGRIILFREKIEEFLMEGLDEENPPAEKKLVLKRR